MNRIPHQAKVRRTAAALLLAALLGGCLGQPSLAPGTPGIDTPVIIAPDAPPPAAGTPAPTLPTATTRLTRDPYLQDVTAEAVTVLWHTADPTVGTLLLRPQNDPAGTPLTLREPSAGTNHRLRVAGLQAGTVYTYSLEADGGLLGASHTFRSAPTAGAADPFSFLVWGDSGCGCPPQMTLAAQMAHSTPQLLLHTGDMIYEDGAANLFDPNFFTPYAGLLATAPVYPVLGNHDVITEKGSPWLHAFSLPGDAGAANPRYYSFDYGNAHFIALDSEEDFGPTSAQYSWLLTDLQSAATQRATWRFAYFHRPPYSSGFGHGSSYDLRESWSPLFERFGVDVVFSGHEHNYERSLPRTDYAAVGGTHPVTYVVTGGGGKQLYNVGHSPWTAASSMVYHFVQVRLAGTHLHLDAIDSNGTVFDTLDLSH
ncbi:MAG: metallophosphoesterase [Chloroflexota bacterium]|nr:metallophosphoesterase [Chloroflexota bacterium]